MMIEKIGSKLIKPHTPTPQNLKNYNISFMDQFIEPMNIAIILFYQLKPENNNKKQLEESLARILVQFYPLSGRYIKDDHMIDCSDQGAEFVEAEAVDVELMDLITKIEAHQLNALLPDQYFGADEAATDPLLSIQATRFPCGGLAIAISVSHRVFDMSSLGTFISAWSNATNNPDINNKVVGSEFTPSFHIPSLLPYLDLGFGASSDRFNVEADEIAVRRLLISKEAFTSLRSRLRPNVEGKTISGVRVVCAVLAKALINLDRAKLGVGRDFLMFQLINMRERTIPPQPKHACGNFSVPSHTRRVAASEVEEIELQELVDLIGDSVRKSITGYAEIVSPDRDGRDIIMNTLGNITKAVWNPEINIVVFSDWSKFGFYKADFGWGKPVWTGIGPLRPRIGTTVLMSDKEGDGIEAWVHLKHDDMRFFEQEYEKIVKSF